MYYLRIGLSLLISSVQILVRSSINQNYFIMNNFNFEGTSLLRIKGVDQSRIFKRICASKQQNSAAGKNKFVGIRSLYPFIVAHLNAFSKQLSVPFSTTQNYKCHEEY